jgi:hypothetical protein
MRWVKVAIGVAFICCATIGFSAQCGFAIQPAADVKWYRDAGWQIPGLADAKSIQKINLTINDKPFIWPDGITVSMIMHEGKYDVRFPAAIFDDNGVHKKMLPRRFGLSQLLRWEMNGTPYAYSYELLPHDVLCSSSVDIIDDKGDGKFRLMTSPGHTFLGINPLAKTPPSPPPVPEWLQKTKDIVHFMAPVMLVSFYPTLVAKTRTRRGWGTRFNL